MSYEKQTSIDKPQCPQSHGDMVLEKTWKVEAKGGKSEKARQQRKKKTGFKIELWRCPKCRICTRIPRKLGENKK